MPASTQARDEKQFWTLVWPSLKTGGWRCEEAGGEGRSGGGSDQSDEGRSAAAGGSSRRTSSRNRKRISGSSASSPSSTGSGSGSSSNSSSPTAAISPREQSVAAAAAAAGGAASTTPPKKPVFLPPVVGVASEALEEAMRRSAPADGSLEEERPNRLVGVNAVIELLQQVPGFPGTTTGIVNFDALAAAARAVMVRTPSPPPVVENGGAAGTPASETQMPGENAVGSPSSRSRSSSISSSDEAVIELPWAVRNRGGMWSSATSNSHSQQQAPSSVAAGSGDVGAGSAAAGNGDASATSATRRGRVIKKPVRLEEQDPGRQTLPGRNGRAEAAAKVAARAAAAGQAQPEATGGGAAGLSSANGKAGGQESGKGGAAGKEPATAIVGGAERCVARLGTGNRKVAQADGSGNGGNGNRNGKSGVETNKGSSSAGAAAGVATSSSTASSLVRTALPLEGRAAGSVPQGDAEEAGDAGGAAGDASKKGRNSVRERDRLVVPDPPPERPLGGLGPAPDDAIKEYKRAFDDVVWPALEEEFGWTKVHGPRMHDVYFLPKGVARGQNGAKCRVDYYDSNRQVLIHMAEHEEKYRGLLERAWAAAILKPRAVGRKSAASGGSKRKKRWTEPPRRKSTMMKKEYPTKVSLVGTAYQVDPSNLPDTGPSEDYVPPEDVQFEQVWDPSVMLPSSEGATAPPDPGVLVAEFEGAVSHDKCLEIIYRCGGSHGDARKMLKILLRSWKQRCPGAGVAAKETATARATVAAALPPSSSPSTGSSSKSGKAAAGGGSCPIVEGSTTVTAKTTRSAVAWGGGAAAVASRSSIPARGGSSGGGIGSVGGSSSGGGRGQGGRAETEVIQDALKSLPGGEAALKRQVEGGVSNSPPGARNRDKLPADLNLSRPWTPADAEKFTRALLEEGSKNFYAVQKALPDRQVCELVDRYYGGWKQTAGYKALKQSISLSKKQSACGRCHAGGDLVCCDGCDAVYHAECVGISVVPEGDWFCPACVNSKRREIQKPAGGSAVLPGAVPGQPSVKPAVAGSDMPPPNAGRSKRARQTSAVDAAATTEAAESWKKPRTVVDDKGGGAGSGSKPESAAARAGGGRQPRPSSQMRMERVPIQLGNARSSTGSVAEVSRKVSPEASAPARAPARAPAPAPAGLAVTIPSASSASRRSEKTCRASDQLGKRTQVPQTPEQHPGKRAARAAPVAAVAKGVAPQDAAKTAASERAAKAAALRVAAMAAAPKDAAKAAAPQVAAKAAAELERPVLWTIDGRVTAVRRGVPLTPMPVRSEVPTGKAGGEWSCLGCRRRNRADDKRCRQCDGLRLVGATSGAGAVAASTSLVDGSEIEPVFSRPASAVANAAAAAALAAAAARDRAATSPRSHMEPIFSRPASAVANAAAAAAAAAAGAASARASRAAAKAAAPPARVWCCRACATFNRRSAVYCVSCRTRKEVKEVEEGKPDWWCCRKCSRFNNRGQDGNTCRVCSTVEQGDDVLEGDAEQEEEVISVGEEISMPGMAAAQAGRFVQL